MEDPPDTDDALPVVSKEEIARVKAEYEERQAKRESAKKEGKKDGDKEEKESPKSKQAASPKPSSPPLQPTPAKSSSGPKRWRLHRDIYQMRLDEHRKRWQAAKAREASNSLPSAPRGFGPAV